jgi:serine/threonine-protein kinase
MLACLKQLADVLDYAHANRVVHGSLKPSAILIDDQQRIQVAGFGLTQMLVMSGIGHIQHTHPHLFSIAGTLVINPLYVAPEVVEGAPVDARADIYSLGVLLFEMLSGRPPFVGTDPLKVAMQHVTGAVPSLLSIDPDLSPALDLVLQHALERDPARRLQTAGALVGPFERVMNVIKAMTNPALPAIKMRGVPETTDKHWIPMPGTTGKMPAIRLDTTGQSGKIPVAGAPLETGKWPRQEPQFSRKTDSFKALNLTQTSGKLEVPPLSSSAKGKQTEGGFNGGASVSSSRNGRAARNGTRRAILVATGSVIAAGAVGVVGLNVLAKMRDQGPSGTTNAGKTPQTVPTTGIVTSSVIQQNSVPVNSAAPFTNSVTGVECILVHLPDGNFAAYQRACTHEAVNVDYHPDTHMLVCPKHGSIFDPSQNAKVINGPAPAPLPSVSINVNADGTITPG